MKKVLILGFFLSACGVINALQVPILERQVTVKVVDQPIGKVLNIISETAEFNFSYNTSLIKTSRLVSIHAENRAVKEVLDQLFNQTLSYQQIGNHLVLQKKPQVKVKKENPVSGSPVNRYNYLITGYIRDIYTGDGLNSASIYEKSSLQSEISGDFGYYRIQLSNKDSVIQLNFSKHGYRDTTLFIHFEPSGIHALNINLLSLHPLIEEEEEASQDSFSSISLKPDSSQKRTRLVWLDSSSKFKVADTKVGAWFIGNYQKLNEKNIRDSFNRNWQLTLFPPLGSNGQLSGLVTNKLSVNLFAGYNGGLDGAEFGGLVNIIKNEMRGAQFSGFANIVGGVCNGAQFAGFCNHNLSDVDAFQAAGFYNYNHTHANGVQLAGFANINRGDVNGVQAAGFLNRAARVDGGQVAGFINIAEKVRGFQIGFINVADTVQGAVIGIFNFIRNGLHQIELSRNESSLYGLAYRSGMDRFYSQVLLAAQLPRRDSVSIVTYGFGMGSSLVLSRVFKLRANFSCQQMTVDFRSDYLNLLNRVNAGLEINLFKGFALFGDLTLNHMLNDVTDTNYDRRFKDFGASAIWTASGRFAQKVWTGFQFGLRIL